MRAEPSVPANVRVFEQVNVLPSTSVHVLDVAGVVKVFLLMLVAVATPRAGVVNVGDVARTPFPVPVVVIASRAVAPELTATIFEPLPDRLGNLPNPVSMASNSVRNADDEPAAPVDGYVVWS